VFDIFAMHLTGPAGFALFALAYVGVVEIITFAVGGFRAVTDWIGDRFEWDRPSWRPWTWRAYRRWYAPGQLVESDDFPLGRVLAVDFGATNSTLDTRLYVQPYPSADGDRCRPCWVPLADVIPAPVGPFAGDLALTDHDRAA